MDDKRLKTPRLHDDAEHATDIAHGGSPQSTAERLAQSIREIPFPAGEVEGARERVGAMLAAAMAEQVAEPTHRPHTTPRRASGRALLRGLVAAAALMILLSFTVGLSRAASTALPSSPLYGVKRAEEWLALSTAWSDQRRGDVLVVIARRRLDELTRAAASGDVAHARSLAKEYQSDVLSIIQLDGVMAAHHEDTHGLSVQLVSILTAQQSALQAVARAGDRELTDGLREAGRAAQAALDRNHILLPGPVPGLDGGAGPDATPPDGGPATPMPTPADPAHSPPSQGSGARPNGQGSPGNGSSGSSGSGGGANGNGGSPGNSGNTGTGSGGGGKGRGRGFAAAGDLSQTGSSSASAGVMGVRSSDGPATTSGRAARRANGVVPSTEARVRNSQSGRQHASSSASSGR